MTTEVIAELDQIINLLEAEIPANISSPKNEKLEKRLQRELARYFRQLEDAFDYSSLDQLYYRYVKESLGSETKDILDPLLATLASNLTYKINEHLATIYLAASAEMITWGKTKGGIPIAYEGPPIEEAIDWASKHCAKLVSQMDEETKRRLAQVISEGIEQKRGIPGLASDIRKEFDDMTKRRAEMIARTETNDALSQAFMDRAHDMNITGKEWVTADPCEICAGNEAEGIVPIDHIFSSGHERPPAHPNCRCALAPARLPE